MSITQIYDIWRQRIEQVWPMERVTRQRNMAWLLVGIFLAESVHISDIAAKIPGSAKLTSLIRRVERFLDNGQVRVRSWYEPVITPILEHVAESTGEIRLLVDSSKVGFNHQLLMVAIAYRRRAIPVAWTWIRCSQGHSSTRVQQALLSYVHALVVPGTPVLLVGDSEFGIVDVMRLLERWGWYYVFRQNGYSVVRTTDGTLRCHFRDLVQAPGQKRWVPHIHLTAKFAHLTNGLAFWAPTEQRPWLLATNLPTAQAVLRAYRRRMWIDEMFGDMKGHGFDLESSHLQHFLRLSRLTLAVALLCLWSLATGAAIIKNGRRSLVDRNERRDLSLFRIGLRWIQRMIANDRHLIIRLSLT